MFGDRLKEARTNKGLTQQQLADAAGITDAAITHIELGRRKPSMELTGMLGQLLGVTTDWLIYGDKAG